MSGAYVRYGPWTDGNPPGVSAEMLNPLENFLVSLNSAAYDSHIASDGSGHLTVSSISMAVGVAAFGNTQITGIITWENTPSAGNQLMNFGRNYGFYSDNAGTLGTTRLWFDGPDRGEFHVEPRTSANFFDEIRLRGTSVQIVLGKNTSPNSTGFSVAGGPTSLDGGNITTDGAGSLTLTGNLTTPSGKGVSFDGGEVATNGSGTLTAKTLTISTGINLVVGTLKRMTFLAGTGNGTVNTNCATTPTAIVFNPCTAASSSQTIGGTNTQSTQVTTGAGLAWGAMCYVQ